MWLREGLRERPDLLGEFPFSPAIGRRTALLEGWGAGSL